MQVFGRRQRRAIHALRRPAFEKYGELLAGCRNASITRLAAKNTPGAGANLPTAGVNSLPSSPMPASFKSIEPENSSVDVRFADLPRSKQQMAAVAELEAGMISARTKVALAELYRNSLPVPRKGCQRSPTCARWSPVGRQGTCDIRLRLAIGKPVRRTAKSDSTGHCTASALTCTSTDELALGANCGIMHCNKRRAPGQTKPDIR